MRIAGNKPLYWFLTWEDWTSLTICMSVSLFFIVFYVLLAKLSQHSKPSMLEAEKKEL